MHPIRKVETIAKAGCHRIILKLYHVLVLFVYHEKEFMEWDMLRSDTENV
jgi:hypothetical protein